MKYISLFLFAGVAILSASSVALASAPAFYSASSLIFTDINTPRNNVSFFVEGFSGQTVTIRLPREARTQFDASVTGVIVQSDTKEIMTPITVSEAATAVSLKMPSDSARVFVPALRFFDGRNQGGFFTLEGSGLTLTDTHSFSASSDIYNDQTAPLPVSAVSVRLQGTGLTLMWRNPVDLDLDSVIVQQKDIKGRVTEKRVFASSGSTVLFDVTDVYGTGQYLFRAFDGERYSAEVVFPVDFDSLKQQAQTTTVTQTGTTTVQFTDVTSGSVLGRDLTLLSPYISFQGFSGGVFLPQTFVTRAEMLKMLLETFAKNALPARVDSGAFLDDNDAPWALRYTSYAFKQWFVVGYGDKKFRPNQNVSFAEALQMTAKICAVQLPQVQTIQPKSSFAVEKWYDPLVRWNAQKQFVTLTDGQTIHSFLTREQMVHIIAQQVTNGCSIQ